MPLVPIVGDIGRKTDNTFLELHIKICYVSHSENYNMHKKSQKTVLKANNEILRLAQLKPKSSTDSKKKICYRTQFCSNTGKF